MCVTSIPGASPHSFVPLGRCDFIALDFLINFPDAIATFADSIITLNDKRLPDRRQRASMKEREKGKNQSKL